MTNIKNELVKKKDVINAWNISLKYSTILMDHYENDDFFDIVYNIYDEYLSELKRKQINLKGKNYLQIWETMIKTQIRNPKRDIRVGAIKILHQTNVQRCDRFN